MAKMEPIDLLREICGRYRFESIAIFKMSGSSQMALTAKNEAELVTKLDFGDHFLPLPKEPAALANIIEVAIIDFLMDELRGRNSNLPVELSAVIPILN